MAPRGYEGHKANEPIEERDSIVQDKRYKQLAKYNQPEQALGLLVSSNQNRPHRSGINVQVAAAALEAV